MENKNSKLFIGGIPAEKLVEKYGSPLYVYEEETMRQRFADLTENIKHSKLKIYYACKANTNVEILKLLKRLGSHIETVSRGEVMAALKAGFRPEHIMFTCGNISMDEMKFLIKEKIAINIDSLSQLEKYGELNPGASVGLRINQGIGAGEHRHVITGGPESKFGIYYTQIEEAKQIAKKYNISIIGVHQHIGSNILDEAIFLKAMRAIIGTAYRFEGLGYINFGGGFGIPYKPGEKPLNMKSLGKKIRERFGQFCKNYGCEPLMIFEPGRYLVCESGILLMTVMDIKDNPRRTFIGVDSGFNHMIRSAFYGSYHGIINASSINRRKVTATIAGNLCESGDVFARDRRIAECKEGDVLALLNAGAYGYSMSSTYNLRARPAEIIVDRRKSRIIRKRDGIEDIL